jgi:hypothetical protein
MILAYASARRQFCAHARGATPVPAGDASPLAGNPGVPAETPADAGVPGRGFPSGRGSAQGAYRGCAHRCRSGCKCVASARVARPFLSAYSPVPSASAAAACRYGRISHRPSPHHPLPGNVYRQSNPSLNIGRKRSYCKQKPPDISMYAHRYFFGSRRSSPLIIVLTRSILQCVSDNNNHYQHNRGEHTPWPS